VQAFETLRSEGVRCRVVSMPSWDLFEQQSAAYRESVLPPSVTARLAIEQGSTLGWERYIGPTGRVIGMHTFGASAPLKALQSKFGFDSASILKVAREMLSSS
jgi:transketolase